MFLNLVSFTLATLITVYVIRKFKRLKNELKLKVHTLKNFVEEDLLRDLRLAD